MRHPGTYFPFLRGRVGELGALRILSGEAKGRIWPVVDLPSAESRSGRSLEEYVATFVREVAGSWGTTDPLYLDLSRFGPDILDTRGRHIVLHLFDCARQLKVQAIPVSGPLSERGEGTRYIDAIAEIAARDGRGAALRIPYEDFSNARKLGTELDVGLAFLSLTAQAVDLFLDAASLPHMRDGNPDGSTNNALITVLVEALKVLESQPFRTTVFAATSVPEDLSSPKEGGPLIFERSELVIWKKLLEHPKRPLLRYADYAIWNSRFPDEGTQGIAPARVRFPVGDRQVFFRGSPGSYRTVCQLALRYPGISDLPSSIGLDMLRRCAGRGGRPGNSTDWVTWDTNVHLETTVRQVERILAQCGRLIDIEPAPTRAGAWQQAFLIEHDA